MTEYSGVNTYCENQCNEGLKVQISNTMSVLKECQIMPYTMLYSVWEIDSGVYVTQKNCTILNLKNSVKYNIDVTKINA